MPTTRSARPSIALAAALLLAGAATAQETTLKYKWTKGDSVRYRITHDSNVKMTNVPMIGQTNSVEKRVFTLAINVKDVGDNGVATLDVGVEALSVESEQMMQPKLTFDSGKPADASSGWIGPALTAMIGEHFTVTMTPTGAVEKVEGADAMVEKMNAAVPANEQTTSMRQQSIRSTYGDEAMRRIFLQSFEQFPAKPVKPGDTWNTDFDMNLRMIGVIRAACVSELKTVEREGAHAVAKITRTIKLTLVNKPGDPGADKTKMTDARGEGETLFDTGSGQAVRVTSRMEMPMEATLADPTTKKDTTMSIAARSTLVLERLEGAAEGGKKEDKKDEVKGS
jgi:hypothetical protein